MRRVLLSLMILLWLGAIEARPTGPAPGVSSLPLASSRANAPAADSARSGFAPARLALLDRFLQEQVDDARIAGAVALVLRDGQVAYERAVGWADKEAGRRMRPDSLFRIASQTKALTSVVVLTLVEEGKLGLGDAVSRYLPSFARTTVLPDVPGASPVPAERAITIRDLLTHTAGISYGNDARVAKIYEAAGLGPAAGYGWYTADKDEPICATMERLGGLPFVAQPGTAWVYGYNTDILGCIAERASGLSLDALIRSRITEPLGMRDTFFFVPPDKRDRLTAVYASDDAGRAVRAPDGARGQGHYVDGPRRSFAGGAGLVSTAPDYAKFLEMIRGGGSAGGVRVLSPRSVALMATNQVGLLHSREGLGFGLGFETVDRFGSNGLSSEGAFGWGGAYGSVYRVDPKERMIMVLMIQQIPNRSDVRDRFPTLVYQALQ